MKYILAILLTLITIVPATAETTSVNVLPEFGAYIKNTNDGEFESYMIGATQVSEETYNTEVTSELDESYTVDKAHPDVRALGIAIAELTSAFTKAELLAKFKEVKQR